MEDSEAASPSFASESSSDAPVQQKTKFKRKYNKRKLVQDPTIYDLIAGRIKKPAGRKLHRGLGTNREVSVAEYYFEHKHVPAEDEDEEEERTHWLSGVDEHVLPSSEVLSAVHRYAAEFFGRTGKKKHLKFMDETALLALGILLEETIKEKLGEKGYLAFLEEDPDLKRSENGGNEEEEESDEDANGSDAGSTESSATMGATLAFSRDDFLTDTEEDVEEQAGSQVSREASLARAEDVEDEDHSANATDYDSMEL